MQFPCASKLPEMHPGWPADGVPLVDPLTIGEGCGGSVTG
jgi:hypothetical protein